MVFGAKVLKYWVLRPSGLELDKAEQGPTRAPKVADHPKFDPALHGFMGPNGSLGLGFGTSGSGFMACSFGFIGGQFARELEGMQAFDWKAP